jgi:hypothetical protein
MADNETVWESAVEIRDAINKLTLRIEEQNRILQRILEVLCAK